MAVDLNALAPFVGDFEGFVGHVYRDPVGVETIAFGETDSAVIERYRHTGISREEGLELLKRRLAEFANAVDERVHVDMNVNQHGALTSFTYNCGVGAFSESTLLRVLNEARYGEVRGQLMRWTKGGGRELPGLVRRRRAEADLFETPGGGGSSPLKPRREVTTGWPEIHSYLRSVIGSKAAHPTHGQTTGGKHSAGSNHYKGLAIDYGDANSDCQAVYDALVPFARSGVIIELIWQHDIWKRGTRSHYAPRDHRDHVHAAIAPGLHLPYQEGDDLTPELQAYLDNHVLGHIDGHLEGKFAQLFERLDAMPSDAHLDGLMTELKAYIDDRLGEPATSAKTVNVPGPSRARKR